MGVDFEAIGAVDLVFGLGAIMDLLAKLVDCVKAGTDAAFLGLELVEVLVAGADVAVALLVDAVGTGLLVEAVGTVLLVDAVGAGLLGEGELDRVSAGVGRAMVLR